MTSMNVKEPALTQAYHVMVSVLMVGLLTLMIHINSIIFLTTIGMKLCENICYSSLPQRCQPTTVSQSR